MPSVTRELEVAAKASPLATLMRGLLERMLAIETLDKLFAEVVGDARIRELTAGTITHLMLQVVSGTHRAVFAAFQADQAQDQPLITTSYQALYERLGRMFPAYSCALVRGSAERLERLMPAQTPEELARWRKYRLRMVDGTMPDGSEHRLKVLRRCGPAGLPAKVVFAFDPVERLCVDAEAAEDAYASDASLAEPLFARAEPSDLYVADRAFCSSTLFGVLIDKRAKFVIREITGLNVQPTSRLRKIGDLEGGRILEQKVLVRQPRTEREISLRRIVFRLAQPTQKGEAEVLLLTNLPGSVSAIAIAELYGRRWDIESQINQLKHVLQGEIETLGQPRAAIFVLCLAMVASNAVSVAQALIAQEHSTEAAELSGYYLADEIAANYRAVNRLVSSSTWQELASWPEKAFQHWCHQITQQVRPAAFHKHPRGPKRSPPRRTSGKHRHHYSTQRLLQAAKGIP